MEEAKKDEPGRFVYRRWKVFLYIGIGMVLSLFVPVLGWWVGYLVAMTAELFVAAGVVTGFLVWACLVGRYYAKTAGFETKRLVGYAARCAVVVGVCAAGVDLCLPIVVGGHATHAAGIWWRMRSFADVEAIRAWGEKVEMKEEGGEMRFAGPPPDCVMQLKPEKVSVDGTTRAVTLEWSRKRLGRWGLWVGSKGAERPKMGSAFRVKDGAYAFSEGASTSRAMAPSDAGEGAEKEKKGPIERLAEEVGKQIEAGWSVRVEGDKIRVSRKEEVEWYKDAGLPENRSVENLRRMGLMSKGKYAFVLDCRPKLDLDELARLQRENGLAGRQLDALFPKVARLRENGKYVAKTAEDLELLGEYEKLEFSMHLMPAAVTPEMSVYVRVSLKEGQNEIVQEVTRGDVAPNPLEIGEKDIRSECWRMKQKVMGVVDSAREKRSSKAGLEPYPGMKEARGYLLGKIVKLHGWAQTREDSEFKLGTELDNILDACKAKVKQATRREELLKVGEIVGRVQEVTVVREAGVDLDFYGDRSDTREVALLLEETGLFEDAARVYEKVEEKPLKSGEMLERCGKTKEALARYERVLGQIPGLKKAKAEYKHNYKQDPWYSRADLEALERETMERIKRVKGELGQGE